MSAFRRVAFVGVLVVVDSSALALAVDLAEPKWFMAAPLFGTIVVLFAAGGLYRRRARLSVLDDLPALIGRVIVAGTFVTCLDLLTDGVEGRETLLTAALFGVFVLPGRGFVYALIHRARRRGRSTLKVIIVGSGADARQLIHTLLERPEYGYLPVGHLGPERTADEDPFPVPRSGAIHELGAVVERLKVDAVVVAVDSVSEPVPASELRTCAQRGCEILVLPRFFEFGPLSRDAELVWGLPLVRMRPGRRRSPPGLQNLQARKRRRGRSDRATGSAHAPRATD